MSKRHHRAQDFRQCQQRHEDPFPVSGREDQHEKKPRFNGLVVRPPASYSNKYSNKHPDATIGSTDQIRAFHIGSFTSTNKHKQRRSNTKTEKETILDGQVVPKLDASNPEHARRIQQRRRMIAFGKNTTGYDEYIKQVPKHKRKPYCPTHPSTPDPTADIPTRRFQGLVRSWRIALHEYDPPELKAAQATQPTKDCEVTSDLMKDLFKVSLSAEVGGDPCVKSKQIVDATRRGLQVEFGNDADDWDSKSSISPTSLVARESRVVGFKRDPTQSSKMEVDFLFGENAQNGDDVLVDYDESDDDDLL